MYRIITKTGYIDNLKTINDVLRVLDELQLKEYEIMFNKENQ